MANIFSNIVDPASSTPYKTGGSSIFDSINSNLSSLGPLKAPSLTGAFVAPVKPATPPAASTSITKTASTVVPAAKPAQPATNIYPPGSSGNAGPSGNQVGQVPTSWSDPAGNKYDSQGNLIAYSQGTIDRLGLGSAGTAAANNGAGVTYPGIVGSLVSSANRNPVIGQDAAKIAADYGNKIATVGQQGANAVSGYSSTGTTPVAEGNAAIIKANTAAQQTALAQGEQAALQGTAQQLTGQNQQASALNQAGNLAQPIIGNYGQTFYNPLNPGAATNNIAGSNPIDAASSIAQQVISGQISPSQAYAMGGSVPNFQSILNQEIQKQSPGFNTATAQGRFDASQQNTTTSGTAPVNAAATAYGNTYNDLLNLQNTTQNVDQFGKLLLQSMVDTNGQKINPYDAKYANMALSAIRDQLSSKQQAVFDNSYVSLKARVADLLASSGGQIPTETTADAKKVIDGTLPLDALAGVLARITTEGNILTQNLQNKLNTAGSVIGAPKTGNSSNPLGI